ncbi:MAG: ImmA/IrrE family metallo-endopeptidase [Neisseriales bacterium]|nr:MAG: ImmA/IrrE family metallo-endopeptidase [Neisseriales bacterium]
MYRVSQQELFERDQKWGGAVVGWRLRRARKSAGFSLRALGNRIGLTHAAIKRYEDEGVNPSSSVVAKLADALGVCPTYFFLPQKITLQAVKYRTRYRLSKKRLEAIQWDIISQVEERIDLERLFPSVPIIPFSLPLRLPKRITALRDIEQVTYKIRQYWALGLVDIMHFVDILESHGIRVITTHMDETSYKKFDGLTAWIGQTPIIVVDRNWPGDHQRFTLAYELGHLILANRLDPAVDEELACHYFAGAFLLPSQPAKQILGTYRKHIELSELMLIKKKFGISMMATLYRAKALEILPVSAFNRQLRQFKINGWHIQEPGDAYPVETTQFFEQLVFRALGEGYIDENKAAALIKVPIDELRYMRTFEKHHSDCMSLPC